MDKYIKYGLQALLVFFFIAPGIIKLTGQPAMVELFAEFGYAVWFMYLIGVCEVAGALGIAFGGFINKKLPQLAVLGLMVIMVGAIGSHLSISDPVISMIPAVINLVLLGIYLRILRTD